MSTESAENPENAENPPPQQPEATLALVALGCGAVGLVLVLVILPQVGLLLGAFGVTTGWRGRQGNVRQGMATAGMILGLFAVVIGITFVLVNFSTPPPA